MSRIDATTDGGEMELCLDINSDIYPMHENEKFTLALATSLDANPDPGHWNQHVKSPLLDKYDYVMSGKVFKIVKEASSKLYVPLLLLSDYQIVVRFFWRTLDETSRKPKES